MRPGLLSCIFCKCQIPASASQSKYQEHLQDWHMVTVAVEIERALQLASVNNGTPVSPIIPPGNSSMCGPPTNPSETSGPFLSPDRIGPLQMSPAFSLNSSHSCSSSVVEVKAKALAVEMEEPNHQEDACTGTGGNSSMVEETKCWVQFERVDVALKNTEQVQIRPGHMEETRSKSDEAPAELGLKKAKQPPTEFLGRERVECDECGKSLSKDCLMKHKRVVHRGEAPYKCLVGGCGIRFANSHSLSDHKRVTHGHPKLKCRVKGCESEFLLRSEFNSHFRTHKIKTECDECGKSMSPRHLSTHKRLAHRGEKPYACNVTDCTERFSRPEALGDHRRIVHGYPKLKCEVDNCGLEFSGYYELRNHHQRTHQSKAECGECGQTVSKYNLSQHMKHVHQGERPFGCGIDGCEKRYTGKIKLADHMRAVHGFPKLKCSNAQCAEEFVYKKHWLMHAKQHLS